ncbi:response regulator transcription factor [Paenibacillus mesophilus]|uniref:response regulator transcription factor n=1 Tax=Paenibacillus mesophilus TaxID=2582849 RepID=UPI00130543D1|nr:helix-turn-helix domain-containing protein [Paenibacillus mesophilus]
MSYRIAIVDDEEDIREGLADLVDWPGLGYTVVARLEDGRDAISFIQSHPVDVILSDIKMTFVSGLELAKYVYDQRYDIKMILISGYKEFEFAQQALNYRVAHYLLKPTRLSEVHQVLRDVKTSLDKEKAEKELALDIKNQNEEMLSMLRRQFFAELAAGTLAEREEIGRRLHFIRLPVDPDISPCCLYSIRIPHDGPYMAPRTADQEANRIFRFIQQAYRNEQDCIQHIPLRSEAGIIRMAAIDVTGGFTGITYIEEKVVHHFATVKSRISAVLGKDACLEEVRSYARLMDLVPAAPSSSEPEPVPNDRLSVSPGPEPVRFDPLVIQKAKTYIQEKYNQDITLEDVAEHVYLSPVYFSRLFKKQTGRNFTDYVTEIRILRAMEYLRQPQYKVYEISSIIGYKSTKYFFKLFKQYAGCTPTEYRNMMP